MMIITFQSEEIWMNNRLPPHLVPQHYIVDLRPDLEFNSEYNAYIFYGSSSVRYLCNVSTEYVLLHTVYAPQVYSLHKVKLIRIFTGFVINRASSYLATQNEFIT